jgi:hypothetical protein
MRFSRSSKATALLLLVSLQVGAAGAVPSEDSLKAAKAAGIAALWNDESSLRACDLASAASASCHSKGKH